MIEISEPLPQSKVGLTIVHDIFSEGKRVGRVEVGYLQKDDVGTFRKYTKRRLSVGQPYGTRIFIDSREIDAIANELGKSAC